MTRCGISSDSAATPNGLRIIAWTFAIEQILRYAELLRNVIIHCCCAASHDRAKDIPFDDFDVNAAGTLNLLEATRRFASDACFIHMSTNKVYGDAPNERPLVELDTRWEYESEDDWNGISEALSISQPTRCVEDGWRCARTEYSTT